mmetsp:Transcript_25216/g.58261  ORF Transcript_25216/g.58261 Transcript_25216/m.58261 type:complete len:187 (-) Transcript_25216:37-597(-)
MKTYICSVTFLFGLLPSALSYTPNAVVGTAARGMSLLAPAFKLEAQLQASALGLLGNVEKEEIVAELQNNVQKNKALIYTYGLSPFSSEAKSILDSTGYDYNEIELGAEWFLLGPRESITRVALAEEIEGGATSLPKIFIGGKCIGGCVELAQLQENGELEGLLKKSGASKKGGKQNFELKLPFLK